MMFLPQRSIALTYSFTAVKWYRSTLYNALILGVCNFLAPGIWGGKILQCPRNKKTTKHPKMYDWLTISFNVFVLQP